VVIHSLEVVPLLLGVLQPLLLQPVESSSSLRLHDCNNKAYHWLDLSFAPNLPVMVAVGWQLEELGLHSREELRLLWVRLEVSNLSLQLSGSQNKACHLPDHSFAPNLLVVAEVLLLGMEQHSQGLPVVSSSSLQLHGCNSKACHWQDHSFVPNLLVMLETRLAVQQHCSLVVRQVLLRRVQGADHMAKDDHHLLYLQVQVRMDSHSQEAGHHSRAEVLHNLVEAHRSLEAHHSQVVGRRILVAEHHGPVVVHHIQVVEHRSLAAVHLGPLVAHHSLEVVRHNHILEVVLHSLVEVHHSLEAHHALVVGHHSRLERD